MMKLLDLESLGRNRNWGVVSDDQKGLKRKAQEEEGGRRTEPASRRITC